MEENGKRNDHDSRRSKNTSATNNNDKDEADDNDDDDDDERTIVLVDDQKNQVPSAVACRRRESSSSSDPEGNSKRRHSNDDDDDENNDKTHDDDSISSSPGKKRAEEKFQPPPPLDQVMIRDSIEWWCHCLLLTQDLQLFHNLEPWLAFATIPERGRLATRLHALGLWQIALQVIGGGGGGGKQQRRNIPTLRNDKDDDDNNNNTNNDDDIDKINILPKCSDWMDIATSLALLKGLFRSHDANDTTEVESMGLVVAVAPSVGSPMPLNGSQRSRARSIEVRQTDQIVNGKHREVELLIKSQQLFSSLAQELVDTWRHDTNVKSQKDERCIDPIVVSFQEQWRALLREYPDCVTEVADGTGIHPHHASLLWSTIPDRDESESLFSSGSWIGPRILVIRRLRSIVLDQNNPFSFHFLLGKLQGLLQAWCTTVLSTPTLVQLGYRADFLGGAPQLPPQQHRRRRHVNNRAPAPPVGRPQRRQPHDRKQQRQQRQKRSRHDDRHETMPNVQVPAAAQYPIHAQRSSPVIRSPAAAKPASHILHEAAGYWTDLSVVCSVSDDLAVSRTSKTFPPMTKKLGKRNVAGALPQSNQSPNSKNNTHKKTKKNNATTTMDLSGYWTDVDDIRDDRIRPPSRREIRISSSFSSKSPPSITKEQHGSKVKKNGDRPGSSSSRLHPPHRRRSRYNAVSTKNVRR
jgi:hypothetical protein